MELPYEWLRPSDIERLAHGALRVEDVVGTGADEEPEDAVDRLLVLLASRC